MRHAFFLSFLYALLLTSPGIAQREPFPQPFDDNIRGAVVSEESQPAGAETERPAVPAGPDGKPAGTRNKPVETSWEASLPLAADAALIRQQSLLLGRLVNGNIEVTSGTLTSEGVENWETFEAKLPAGLSQAVKLLGREGHWIVADEEGGQIGIFTSAGEERLVAALPFERLDDARIQEGKILLLGAKQRQLYVAERSLDETDPEATWISGAPIPEPLEGAALLSSENALYVLGGQVTLPDGREYESAYVWESELAEDGTPSFWEPLRQTMTDAPGSSRAVQAEGIFVLVPEDFAQKPRMLTLSRRPNGTFGLWRSVLLDAEGLQNIIPVADETGHGLLIAGETPEGEPRMLGWPLPGTQQMIGRMNKEAAEQRISTMPGRPKNEERPRFRAGKKRAEDRGTALLVVVPGEAEEGEALLKMLDNGHVKIMTRDLVISQPWPDEVPEVLSLAGLEEEQLPAMVLLGRNGDLMTTHTGPADREDFFNLLKALWAPAME